MCLLMSHLALVEMTCCTDCVVLLHDFVVARCMFGDELLRGLICFIAWFESTRHVDLVACSMILSYSPGVISLIRCIDWICVLHGLDCLAD